jgi:hypothetical protein
MNKKQYMYIWLRPGRKIFWNNSNSIKQKYIQIIVPDLSCAICHVNLMQIAQDNSETTKYVFENFKKKDIKIIMYFYEFFHFYFNSETCLSDYYKLIRYNKLHWNIETMIYTGARTQHNIIHQALTIVFHVSEQSWKPIIL